MPICKNLTSRLPKGRPYSEIDAAFCLQVDLDNGTAVTISGYAALWQWSRKKVRRLLYEMGVVIEYPETTTRKQNQKGQIRVQIKDRSEQKKGQIRCLNTKGLQRSGNRSKIKKGQIRDRSGTTTIDPIILDPKKNNNNGHSFLLKDESSYHVDNDFYEILKNSYPNIDIESELKKLSAWCFSNSSKRKTRKGAKRFVNAWMSNAKPTENHQPVEEFDFANQFHEE